MAGLQNDLEMQTINWNSKANQKLLSWANGTYMQVIIEKEPIDVNTDDGNQTIDFAYNIILLPTVTFSNYLPYAIKYKIASVNTVEDMSVLQPGEVVKLYNAKVGSVLLLEMDNYAGSVWFASHAIEYKGKEDGKLEESNLIDFR